MVLGQIVTMVNDELLDLIDVNLFVARGIRNFFALKFVFR